MGVRAAVRRYAAVRTRMVGMGGRAQELFALENFLIPISILDGTTLFLLIGNRKNI